MSSSIKPDGKKIQQLRSERGWTVEDLARKAGCVPKSIYNAEQGKNIRRPTLAEIAAALKVEPKDLIQAEQPEPRGNLIRLQLMIEADMDKLNQSAFVQNLVELLTKVLSPTGEIAITDVKAGSVVVSLQMNEEDALRLVALFPDFKEHAREAIRATPEGEAYLRGTAVESQQANRIKILLELVDAIQELRLPAGPDPEVPQRESSKSQKELFDELEALMSRMLGVPLSVQPRKATG
jgi:transcriptional regulator with XRE-family HTH domain